jgi:hypothetical protein
MFLPGDKKLPTKLGAHQIPATHLSCKPLAFWQTSTPFSSLDCGSAPIHIGGYQI